MTHLIHSSLVNYYFALMDVLVFFGPPIVIGYWFGHKDGRKYEREHGNEP